MGKGRNSRRKSHLNEKHSSHSTINSRISKRKKENGNPNKLIRELFKEVRQNRRSSLSSNTVIELDDTEIDMPCKNTLERNNETLIIIKDDNHNVSNEQCMSHGPLHSSTPISSKSKIFQDMSLHNSSQVKLNKEIVNLTKEINRDSYLTIDLTTDSGLNATSQSDNNNIIDLVNTTDDMVYSRNSNLSSSGDSDVTVINTKNHLKNRQMKQFANGIAKMDSTGRGKLLEFMAQEIFNGCSTPRNNGFIRKINPSTETVQHTYIREKILGQKQSRNSVGSNIYNPEKDVQNRTGLRMIVIDGSNVAMQHTKGRIFSVKGLKICIDYFLQRGHVVKAFVPHFRCKFGKSTDGKLLDQLERQGHVVYTPSREIKGKMITSYDDRYIVQCAAEFDGVIVSGDNYRDLINENQRWRFVIENRLLQFTWVDDMLMFPRDPLGRFGPNLHDFLRHPPQ